MKKILLFIIFSIFFCCSNHKKHNFQENDIDSGISVVQDLIIPGNPSDTSAFTNILYNDSLNEVTFTHGTDPNADDFMNTPSPSYSIGSTKRFNEFIGR